MDFENILQKFPSNFVLTRYGYFDDDDGTEFHNMATFYDCEYDELEKCEFYDGNGAISRKYWKLYEKYNTPLSSHRMTNVSLEELIAAYKFGEYPKGKKEQIQSVISEAIQKSKQND